jgi:hypothetical protein
MSQPVHNSHFNRITDEEERNVAKGSGGLSAERLRELARSGAETMLKQLRAEIIAIERTFPELALPQKRRAVRRAFNQARARVRKMTDEEKQAVSARMKKYWAERRKAKSKVK